ncbi:PhnD/SsuA/transferrin family substrate-binding protein [Pelagibius sp. CAU 1746]|uniref:phosphate/phosphite/phosphonate ABC transporter substrate-binding protein n=1 Tax=Pelagibius sp. CAU 1746 TaxID=3140370 RepID=UPI00325B8F17
MRASLPMYELPGLEAATDAWWASLAAALRAVGLEEVPQRLTRSADPAELWTAPELLFSQTCGYPLTHALAGKVTLVATPVYDVPGCAGGHYRSEILVRAGDAAPDLAALRGRRAAANARDSQSGYSALRHAVAPLAEGGRFFSEVKVSGSHLASMTLVAAGEADVCAIDCVTYHLLKSTDPGLTARLRVLAPSAQAPALPFIARCGLGAAELQRLRDGLAAAVADPALAEVRAALLIKDVVIKPLSDYDRILELEAAAVAAGYPELA